MCAAPLTYCRLSPDLRVTPRAIARKCIDELLQSDVRSVAVCQSGKAIAPPPTANAAGDPHDHKGVFPKALHRGDVENKI